MSYSPTTDFLALARLSASGVALARAPGLDIVMAALARAGLFALFEGQTAPTVNQATTVWLKPAQPSWSAEATFYLWNGSAYVLATPALWSTFLTDVVVPTPAATLVFETVAKAQAAAIPAVQLSFMVIRYAVGYEAVPAVYMPGAANGPNAFQDAGARWWQLDLSPTVHYASWYGVNGDNQDYTTRLQLAISFLNFHTLKLPFGTIVVSAGLNATQTVQGAPGLRMEGAGGGGQTVIDNRCTGGAPMLRIYGAPFAFSYLGHLSGIKFITTTGSTSTFVDILAEYDLLVEDCQFVGGLGNGVSITCNLGDADASNQVTFKRCLFTNNQLAGLASNNTTTFVQTTFIRCEDCFFNANGLAGWYNIGLSSSMYNCGFTENGNGAGGQGALWVVNNAASNAQFTAIGCSFENNYHSAVRLDALAGGQFIDCEIAGGTPPIVSTAGFQLNGSSKIRFEGTRVRIGATLNPYTAFNFTSGSTNNVVSNTDWNTYDATGQVRYASDNTSLGNRYDDSFSAVQEGADNGVMSIAFVNGANENVAIPLTGTTFSISGPTAVFNVGGLQGGQPGRRIRLINGTGFTGTFNDEDAGSTAANRLWTGAGGRAVLTHTSVTLEYNSQVSRWVAG